MISKGEWFQIIFAAAFLASGLAVLVGAGLNILLHIFWGI